MTLSQVVSEAAAMLSEDGDLVCIAQVRVTIDGIEHVAQAAINSLSILNQEGAYKKAMFSTDDGNAG